MNYQERQVVRVSKPIIRHCENCEYGDHKGALIDPYCSVRYKYVFFPRIKAWFCRFYKKRGGKSDD